MYIRSSHTVVQILRRGHVFSSYWYCTHVKVTVHRLLNELHLVIVLEFQLKRSSHFMARIDTLLTICRAARYLDYCKLTGGCFSWL